MKMILSALHVQVSCHFVLLGNILRYYLVPFRIECVVIVQLQDINLKIPLLARLVHVGISVLLVDLQQLHHLHLLTVFVVSVQAVYTKRQIASRVFHVTTVKQVNILLAVLWCVMLVLLVNFKIKAMFLLPHASFALKVTNMSAQPQVVRSVQQVSTKIKIQLFVLTVKIVPQLSIKTKLDSAAANKIYANAHLVELQHLVPDAPHITMIYAQGVL
jgi:DUF971 family protein